MPTAVGLLQAFGFRAGAKSISMYMSVNIQVRAMADRHSIAEARRNLPSLVRDAESGKVVELTRRGEPVAVLVGHREFERLSAGRQSFANAYREFVSMVGLEGLALDPDELFGDLRDRTPGRDVRL